MINIIKHADAKKVTTSFSFDSDEVFIAISDDGVGFDPGSVREDSYGLDNIKKRIKENSGKLNIETQRDSGTNLLIQLPLV